MKRRRLVLTGLVFLVLLASLTGAWIAIQRPLEAGPSAVGIRNAYTPNGERLRQVTLALDPGGEINAGDLGVQDSHAFASPGWPAPKAIRVRFSDSEGVRHALDLGGAPKGFQGRLWIVIEKHDAFVARLDLEP